MTADQKRVTHPGSNCWCRAQASRAAVIVDTATYFAAFAQACEQAQRQVLILGWDFDRRERLHRDDRKHPEADELGNFLVSLVRRKPGLKLYLLSWDFNMIYAAERELLPALRLRLQTPPRFHFRLDGNHPRGASHHQKLVVIDDRIAFVGGIDLSRWRWDTCEHAPDDPRRRDPNGKAYQPFHDLMWVLEGDAAVRLGELARERWKRAHGRRIKPPPATAPSPWPALVTPGLHEVNVAIARTEPPYAGRPAVSEVHQLYLDSIAAAKDAIYIENQYFTATSLSEALAKRLAEPDGPDVVLVLPQRTGGWLEQMTMDVLRARVLEHLREADQHGRLRVFYPHQPGLGQQCITVHAKLMIVDDRILRVGSANASSRSMGLDTECDVVLEAGDEQQAEFIAHTRHRLLAEHLGCEAADVAAAEQRHGRLTDAIKALQSDGRSLRALDGTVSPDIDDMVPDGGVIDPPEPLSPDYFVSQYIPDEGRADGRRRAILFAVAIVLLLGLAAAWRWTPLQDWLNPTTISQWLEAFSSPVARAAAAIGAFTLAALLLVPLTLLAVIGGLVFSGWQAFVYVLTGAVLASLLGFAAGRLLGRDLLDRVSGSRVDQLSKRIAKRGIIAVAILRLVPVAPFAVFNLVAGSSHLGLRQFAIGSTLGLTPGLAAITLFSGSLAAAIRAPSVLNIAMVAGFTALLVSAAWLMKRWLRSA